VRAIREYDDLYNIQDTLATLPWMSVMAGNAGDVMNRSNKRAPTAIYADPWSAVFIG